MQSVTTSSKSQTRCVICSYAFITAQQGRQLTCVVLLDACRGMSQPFQLILKQACSSRCQTGVYSMLPHNLSYPTPYCQEPLPCLIQVSPLRPLPPAPTTSNWPHSHLSFPLLACPDQTGTSATLGGLSCQLAPLIRVLSCAQSTA